MTLRSTIPRVRLALVLLAPGVISLPARADVHTIQVNEYYTQCDDGSTAVQYIELKPFVLNQFFRQCAQIQIKRTLAGPDLFFAKPVFVGHLDAEVFLTSKTFLIATASFQTITGITPDLIIPDGIMDPAGGVIRFAADFGCAINWGTIDLVAYGDQGADPAPGPNQAANLTAFGGAFTLGTPSPENFAGATSTSWTCISPICAVEPTSIDFGGVVGGGSKDATFTITNTAGGMLTGTVSESCDHYSIVSGGGPYSLAGGESLFVTVRFEPAALGVQNCTVETGDPLCADVDCTGNGLPTGIEATPLRTIELHQNYPNPFNPSTQIRFSVHRDTRVVLSIHDISGRLVRVLVNRGIQVGTYTEEWDARDDRGNPVPSGVYLYRLVTNDYTETRKMVLLK